jgi:hypothetical protein
MKKLEHCYGLGPNHISHVHFTKVKWKKISLPGGGKYRRTVCAACRTREDLDHPPNITGMESSLVIKRVVCPPSQLLQS